MKAKSTGGRRPSYADIAYASTPSSICIFRSPKSSPTNSPVAQRKLSAGAESSLLREKRELGVCPVRRMYSSGNFKGDQKVPSPLLDGLVANKKPERKRRITLAKLETTNNNKLTSPPEKKIIDEESGKGLTMDASFVEVDTDSLTQLMDFKGKHNSVITHKEKFWALEDFVYKENFYF